MCVFQEPLSLRIALFPSPLFSLDVRFQSAADLMLFFRSIWAVVVSRVVNSILQIHSRGDSKRLFLLLSFWGGFLKNMKKVSPNLKHFIMAVMIISVLPWLHGKLGADNQVHSFALQMLPLSSRVSPHTGQKV